MVNTPIHIREAILLSLWFSPLHGHGRVRQALAPNLCFLLRTTIIAILLRSRRRGSAACGEATIRLSRAWQEVRLCVFWPRAMLASLPRTRLRGLATGDRDT